MLISCTNWALNVSTEWDGWASCSTQGQSAGKRKSIAVLVCRNVPEG